jgi:hypothetical protein
LFQTRRREKSPAACDVCRERATGIEPAFSAWEAAQKDTGYQVKAAKFQVGGIRTRLLLFAVLPCLLWRVARNRADPVSGTPWHGPS